MHKAVTLTPSLTPRKSISFPEPTCLLVTILLLTKRHMGSGNEIAWKWCESMCVENAFVSFLYGGPKGSNTNQFTKIQNSFPKHKSISQNTNQFTKTQINFLKHESVYQTKKQFLKTQTNFPKHKSVYQNTNQFHKAQTNFAKHESKDWALALSLSESLEGTHSQDFPRQHGKF